jgi:hypothetical protein
LGGHLKPLGIDQVSVLKTARAKANRLFTALSGAVCTGMPSWRAVDVNNLHFVIEPRHARRIVPGTEIAAGVCGFDPIAAKRVFAAHQGFNASSIVSGGRDLYPPSRISRRRQSMGSGF